MATIKRELNYRIDFSTMTLTMTADFSNQAYDPTSKEYEVLTRLQKDFPDLTVVRKTHRKPTKYVSKSTGETFKNNQFKDLTYKRMEQFLDGFTEDKSYKAEYLKVKAYASLAKKNGYPLVRDWFIKQFPDFRKNPMVYFNNPPQIIPFTSKSEDEGQAEQPA